MSDGGAKWRGVELLVDDFNTVDNVRIARAPVFLCDCLKDGRACVQVTIELPLDGTGMSRVVISVLRARRAVDAYNGFDAGGSKPGHGFLQVGIGAGDVRSSGVVICPVADWDSNTEET